MKNRAEKMKKLNEREFYLGRSLLGNDWAMLYFMLGGRETGKYSIAQSLPKRDLPR